MLDTDLSLKEETSLLVEFAGETPLKAENLLLARGPVPKVFLGERCRRISEADLGFILRN